MAIVDCDDRMRTELAELLSAQQLHLLTFSSSSDFLAVTRSSRTRPRFDLLLCRMELEEDRGLSVLRTFRDRAADVPMVIYSTHGDVTAAVRSFREGAVDYIDYAKPDACFCERVLRQLNLTYSPDFPHPNASDSSSASCIAC